MYTPQAFIIDDPETIRSFIREYGFGLLISEHSGKIETTFTPMYLTQDSQFLYGHIAKANPQWKSWAKASTAKAIFRGPHAYVSPGDYPSGEHLPTWNYTTISIDGPIEPLTANADKQHIVEHLISQYESSMETPWLLDTDDEKLMGYLEGIVGFRIEAREIQAKFKLNQNKSAEDQQCVLNELRKRGGELNRSVADLMQANLNRS